jgi:hypothetical protein
LLSGLVWSGLNCRGGHLGSAKKRHSCVYGRGKRQRQHQRQRPPKRQRQQRRAGCSSRSRFPQARSRGPPLSSPAWPSAHCPPFPFPHGQAPAWACVPCGACIGGGGGVNYSRMSDAPVGMLRLQIQIQSELGRACTCKPHMHMQMQSIIHPTTRDTLVHRE